MDKLIELLNEYEKSKTHIDYTWKIEDKSEKRMCWVEYTWAYVNEEEMERIVISKKYMFIKRLVDNDKIDRDKFKEKNWTHWMRNLNKRFSVIWEWMIDWEDYSELESVLMILSIQDNPIEFLCSVLK